VGSLSGPIEDHPWPEELEGHVATAEKSPRIHGYDVQGDLARHYSFAEVFLLTLTGELPSREQTAAFETAMTFVAPVSVAEAPAHAAALARICGARSSGVLGVGVLALVERARSLIEQSAAVLDWLRAHHGDPSAPVPIVTNEENGDAVAVQALRTALAARGVRIDVLEHPLSLHRAILATLWFAGLERPEQLETALVLAWLPCVVAEANAHVVASFRDYPTLLPPFVYEDP
jgi:hypothetical protein